MLACPAAANDCPAATILLNAFDRDFNIQRDLRAEDIKVEVDRKQVAILSVSLDIHPRRIVVMVDSSGSMGASSQNGGWGITLPAAGYAVDAVPASASSELVTFGEQLRRESTDFENRQTVGERVLALRKNGHPHGHTSLFDSIHQVLIGSEELHFGDAIYLVTDGGDDESRTSLQNLEEELISRGVRVFVFLILPREFHTEEEQRGAEHMDGLAESTGGIVVRISAAEITENGLAQLQKLAPRIIDQVENVYRLELAMPKVERSTRVKVGVIDHDQVKNIRNLAYSRQIVPCSRKP